MFKTETIQKIKDIELRAKMISDMINAQEKLGWDFHSGISTHKYSVILVFKRNAQHKMNEDINKGIHKVKDKFSKVVDAMKSNDK